jgi:hypothetical protein
MEQVLNKFVTTEGVKGAYILNPDNGIFENMMPPKFSEENLHQIGRNLLGITGLSRSDFSDPKDVSFFFKSAALRIQDFNKGYHLITMFSPKMNSDVLDKAVGRFINEFDQAITSSLATPSSDGRGLKPRQQSSAALSAKNLMKSGPLADPLDMMQSTLAKVVGPMARVIFFDALLQWQTLHTPGMDSLPVLTDIVSKEIGDAVMANSYKKKLPSFCCNPAPGFSAKKRKNKLKKPQAA